MALFTTKTKTRIGVVQNTELTFGSAGHQWTTIDGVAYATYWDWHTRDWGTGDTVVFRPFKARLMGQSSRTLQADDIRKATPADYPEPSFWTQLSQKLKTIGQ